ncbi:MAG: hypothetical protein ABJL92_16595 [Sulfitobacter sp.]|uniref:hypothetical protein n=1 Tax=Sulfitobacter sp. TaxID=1903071 RepID=UPI003299CBF1
MMRYYQTFARIGVGLAAFAMLTWFLWPRPTWEFQPEAFFAFCVAAVVWVFTEFKRSEEVIYRASTPNDIRFGRELLGYGVWQFRSLLKEHDYHSGIEPRLYSEASALRFDTDIGIARFQDRKAQAKYKIFYDRLSTFVLYLAKHSAIENYGGAKVRHIVPARRYTSAGIDPELKAVIEEANRLASEAWDAMLPLITEIKDRIPEVFDEPIKRDWFRTRDE